MKNLKNIIHVICGFASGVLASISLSQDNWLAASGWMVATWLWIALYPIGAPCEPEKDPATPS